MSYTHTTLASAAAYLASRLSDAASRFYTATEQQNAIREALRIWNVLTSQDRARGYLQTTPLQAFYALPSTLNTLPDGTGTLLRAYTITDATVVAEINAHLLESVQPTDMFTAAQTLSALTQSRDNFLADTYAVLARRTGDAIDAFTDTVDYPDSVSTVRRVVWRDDDSGAYVPLLRSDERSATAYARDWQTASVPRAYSLSAVPSLQLRVLPPPATFGTVESLVVESGAILNGLGTALGLPDDLAWGVKYGALAALFASDGPANDPERAARCASLYQLAAGTALHVATILHAEIDGRPTLPAAIYRTDRFRGGWEGKTESTPSLLSICGPDLIALTPLPDSRPHTIALDVVRNTLVPTAAGEYVQIAREHLPAVLGLAQWVCLLKVGGAEFAAAEPLFDAFLAEATTFAHQRSAVSNAITRMQQTGTLNTLEFAPENDPTVSVRNADEVRQERNARRRRAASPLRR